MHIYWDFINRLPAQLNVFIGLRWVKEAKRESQKTLPNKQMFSLDVNLRNK